MEDTHLPTVPPGEDKKRKAERKERKKDAPEDGEDAEDRDQYGDETSAMALNSSEPFGTGELLAAAKESGKGTKSTGQVCIDFRDLPESVRRSAGNPRKFADSIRELQVRIDSTEKELESISPNLKATTRFATTEKKLDEVSGQLENAREASRKAVIEFSRIKEQRTAKFMSAFEQINDALDKVYQELTEGTRAAGVHGTAYLTLDDAEEPYNGGTKYHATPPMKRFMGMDALSGGERTMAALALLFAIHSVQPSPFYILDEVDAALDSANVQKLAQYLRAHCGRVQFIVISLKEQLYQVAHRLVGVYKDRANDTSAVLTLDLAGIAQE